ncbi:MAG: hypothetical protein HY744_02235 [Deltaproteobacteria bacterium]|nr:hypothetical protein [Deltaproteobacteria bacterium]
MSALSSFLLSRQAVSLEALAGALRSQILLGGELGTSLLDEGALTEAALVGLLGEFYGLPPGPTGRLPPVPPELDRLLPAQVAAAYRVYPLSVGGGELEVATSRSLYPLIAAELSEAVGKPLRQVVVAPPRLHEALSRHCGLDLDLRTRGVLSRLAGAAPPPAEAPPAEAPLAQAPPAAAVQLPPEPSAPESVGPATLRGELAALLGSVPAAVQAQAMRRAYRYRGPFPRDEAELHLAEARDVATVLGVLVRFCQQYFERTALFVVQGDRIQGRLVHGAAAELASFGASIDEPSVLRRAVQTGQAALAPLGHEGLDAKLHTLLPGVADRQVAVIPVRVRRRVVALLYGDDIVESVDAAVAAQLGAFAEAVGHALIIQLGGFAEAVGQALVRVILERKRRRASRR